MSRFFWSLWSDPEGPPYDPTHVRFRLNRLRRELEKVEAITPPLDLRRPREALIKASASVDAFERGLLDKPTAWGKLEDARRALWLPYEEMQRRREEQARAAAAARSA